MRLELGNDDGFMRASSCKCGERSDAISDQGEYGGGRDALDDKAARGWMASGRCINKHRWGATRKAASLDYEVANRG